MHVLFVTSNFNTVGLANRLTSEGHKVDVLVSDNVPFGRGLLNFVYHPHEAIRECKFIIADGPVDPVIYKMAKTFNKPIIGASPLTDLMNTDIYREYQVAKSCGVPLPHTDVVTDVGDLYSKVIEWQPSRTILRYDRESVTVDHQSWLAWAMHNLPLNKHILMQETCMGELIDIVGWFDGLNWSRPFLLKSVGDDKLYSSLMLALYNREWVRSVIEPFGKFLTKCDYHGPFRVRVSLDKAGPQVISTFSGFEFPSVYAFFEGLKEDIADFLNRVAFSVCKEHDITTDYMVAMGVGTTLRRSAGIPIIGIDEGNSKHLFFGSVDKLESGIVVNVGLPWLYTLTTHGRDIDESLGRLYHTNKVVRVPEPSFMSNLGSSYKPWFTKIKTLGYL